MRAARRRRNPGERVYAVGNNQLLMEAKGLTQSEAVALLKRRPLDDLGMHNYIWKSTGAFAGHPSWKKVRVKSAAKNPRRTVRANGAMIPCKLKRMPNGTVKVYVAPGALAKVRNPFDLHTKLSHAVTEYDRKQSTKKFYNRYALPQYLGAVQDAMAEIDKGKTVRKALTDHFSGRLLDIVLKAAGEGRSTRQEQMF